MRYFPILFAAIYSDTAVGGRQRRLQQVDASYSTGEA